MAAPAISWRVSLAPVSVQTGVAILVPARGGSKRLPGKNIRRLGGVSLLEWTWRAVQAAEIPVVPFLSTDDEAIADEGRRLGFRVPGLRPRQLAEDDTPTPDVVLHWLDTTPEFGQSEPELIMLLQATSPFRHPDLLRDGLANMRANKEAQALVTFHHPNIVGLYRFFEANGTAYLVMAYEDGESLAAILEKRKTLPEAEVRGWLGPLLSGLAHVHKAGFLHRDIKPGNIYIRKDGSPVLLDFGAARLAVGSRSQSLTSIVSAGTSSGASASTSAVCGSLRSTGAEGCAGGVSRGAAESGSRTPPPREMMRSASSWETSMV